MTQLTVQLTYTYQHNKNHLLKIQKNKNMRTILYCWGSPHPSCSYVYLLRIRQHLKKQMGKKGKRLAQIEPLALTSSHWSALGLAFNRPPYWQGVIISLNFGKIFSSPLATLEISGRPEKTYYTCKRMTKICIPFYIRKCSFLRHCTMCWIVFFRLPLQVTPSPA